MNKLGKCIVLLILLCVITAIIIIFLDQESKKNAANYYAYNNNKDDENYNYTLYSTTDYIATKPEEIYKYADLVIIGNYKSNNKCYMGNAQAVVTESVFNVKKVIKGNYNKDEININYYGGTVCLDDYIKCLSEAQIRKRELNNLTEKQRKSGTVSYDVGKTKVDISENNEDYLIFLSYDEKSNIYFVLADGYGMRKISNDNKIYNLDTKKYENNFNEISKNS